jgi:hypothetical protein
MNNVDSAMPSSALLSSDIMPWPAWLGSIITSMTQQQYHTTANTDSAAPSSAWLGHIIASMTRWLHHAMANTNSIASSPRWLDGDIMPQPTPTWQHHCQHDSVVTSRHDWHFLSSAIANMTRQHYHQHDSTVTSRHCQHWLGCAVTSMTFGLDAYFPDQ